MVEYLTAVASIVLVDLALSGDNALVIGAAAASLPRRQQRLAILVGGAGAIALRILLGAIAALLLRLPLLQAIGGAVLLVVAWRLLAGRDRHQDAHDDPKQHASDQTRPSTPTTRPAQSLMGALLTIVLADVTMSLDNVLAVGALSRGNLPLLAGGLLLSMIIVLLGSALVARLMGWLPWLLDLAALVLGWTAAQMVLHDPRTQAALAQVPRPEILVPALSCALVLAADVYLRRRVSRRTKQASAPGTGAGASPAPDETDPARP